jgi:MFS family permease
MTPGGTPRRLQIAHLFLGMMFWYGIEQLFLNKYLGTSSARGYMIIAFTASLIAFDIPGGLLADKLGRKKTLLIACIVQVIALLVLASSNSLLEYSVGTVLFGLFLSLLNGAAQALLYDHLLQHSLSGSYGKQQGKVYAMFLIGAGIANISSGFIAHFLGLRAPYYLSIIPAILAFVVLLPITEPAIKKQASKWFTQLGAVARAIRNSPRTLVFGVQFLVSQLILFTIGEFGQIYILSFHVSTIWLGILWSVVALFAAGGRFWAHHVQTNPLRTLLIYSAVLVIFTLVRVPIGIALFWVLYGCNEALANIAETEIQDEAESSMRATLFSCISFCANLLAIPAIFAFNKLYVDHSIYTANSYAAMAGAVILLVSLVAASRLPKKIARNA